MKVKRYKENYKYERQGRIFELLLDALEYMNRKKNVKRKNRKYDKTRNEIGLKSTRDSEREEKKRGKKITEKITK